MGQETKAEAEEEKVGFSENRAAEKKELRAARKNMKALHASCDWLLANYDLRQKSRMCSVQTISFAVLTPQPAQSLESLNVFRIHSQCFGGVGAGW